MAQFEGVLPKAVDVMDLVYRKIMIYRIAPIQKKEVEASKLHLFCCRLSCWCVFAHFHDASIFAGPTCTICLLLGPASRCLFPCISLISSILSIQVVCALSSISIHLLGQFRYLLFGFLRSRGGVNINISKMLDVDMPVYTDPYGW